MKIVVGVKRVADAGASIRVRPDGSGVDTGNARLVMNPFDEIAVEEAVRLKERGAAHEVVAVTIGPDGTEEMLRTALAMGADRATHVKAANPVEPLAVAKVLAAIVARERPDLVMVGKQAIDDDCNQTGQMLAALLGWGQGTFISALTVDERRIVVTREVDAGMETLSLPLPAVVTTDLRLNTPRFTSLPSIMKARKKPIDVLTPAALDVDMEPRLQILLTEEPPKRRAGLILASVDELLARLRGEAQLLQL